MHPHLTYSLIALVFTALFTGGLRLSAGLSFFAAYAISVNLTALLICGYDKSIAAQENKERIPESLLLGIALVGGSAGLLVGMMKFRHKTTKASFQLMLAIILLLQVAVVRYFYQD